MTLKNIFILLVGSISFCQNSFSQRTVSDSSKHVSFIAKSKTRVDSLFEEVNSKFTIGGKPINPKVIEDLAPSMFDGPIITSLDLGMANQSNRYFCDSCLGKYKIDFGVSKDGRWEGYFSYSYLGKTTNNIHVIQTSSGGGGSGSWSSILFLSIHIRTAYSMGEKQQQLIMNLEGSAPGSYASGAYGTSSKIVIKQNKVVIDYVTSNPDENGKDIKTEEHKEFQF